MSEKSTTSLMPLSRAETLDLHKGSKLLNEVSINPEQRQIYSHLSDLQ